MEVRKDSDGCTLTGGVQMGINVHCRQDRLTLLKVIFDPSCNTDQGVLELRECSGFTKPTTRSESEKWKKLFFLFEWLRMIFLLLLIFLHF
jgi:hypothetical protein